MLGAQHPLYLGERFALVAQVHRVREGRGGRFGRRRRRRRHFRHAGLRLDNVLDDVRGNIAFLRERPSLVVVVIPERVRRRGIVLPGRILHAFLKEIARGQLALHLHDDVRALIGSDRRVDLLVRESRAKGKQRGNHQREDDT